MGSDHRRPHGFVLGALGAVAAFVIVRLAVGAPFPGATLLLLLACGLALLPFVPRELCTPTRRVAVVPALAIVGLSILLTSASIVGVPLTESTIPLAVFALVCAATVTSTRVDVGQPPRWRPHRELAVGVMLAGVFAVALASSWDIVYPLQVARTDVGHYLLYAEEVASQERLLADDPLAGEEPLYADPAGVGALYGSTLILDGVSSWSLGFGLAVLSAVSVLSVFAAAGALWGGRAGLVAAAAYTVAPIRLDPMYWHGLGTTLALVFVPLVALALALMLRGQRDWRTIGLLAASLVGVAAAHSTTTVVVATFVFVAVVVDLARRLLRRPRSGALRSWWREGLARPVVIAVVAASVAGLGVVAHLRAQAVDLGRPVDFRLLGPDWVDRAAISGYYSWQFLALVGAALALVLSSRRLRSDRGLLSVLALALACIVVNESWRAEFPFEYRRVVYYLAIAMVLLVGAAFLRFRPTLAWVAVWTLALLYVAQLSTGLRLPQRVLAGAEPGPEVVPSLRTFRADLDAGRLPETDLVVTDACLHFAVPYLVRRPTLPAFGERQVGFENRLPLARTASTILRGGASGRELAARLGVGYVVVDPTCVPELQERLGGTVVVENEEVVVLRLRGPA